MGKRFLISLLLVIVIVAVVAIGASFIFHGSYEDVSALQEQAAASTDSDTFGQTTDLPVISAAPVTPVEPASGDEQASTEESNDGIEPSATPATDVANEYELRAQAFVEKMTLQEKICQMLFVTPEALTGYNQVTQSGEATKASIEEFPVGGIIYFSENLVTMDQTKEMIDNIQSYSRDRSGLGLFIGVDEEGGSVARLADSLGTTQFEDMSVYGAEGDPQKAYEIGATLAADLKEFGFNVDFAPVADVLTNEENEVVKERSFGSDPDLVSSMVSQEVKGFVENGVLCAPKHFPGHGSTGGDTHDGFAASTRTMEELQACDLKPFQAVIDAGAPMIMVGHMTMTEIDSENPASLSNAVITGILREQMGYTGIIITDSLSMNAITDLYTSGEAAVKAIQAGCDMLLCISNVESAVDAVTEAVNSGEISQERIDESVIRILTAKIQFGIVS